MTLLQVCRTRWFFVGVLALSGLLALLQLSTSLYVLFVYDRVLPSGNAAALLGLTGLALVLHVAFAGLDAVRTRMVCRAGLVFVAHLDRPLLAALEAPGSGLPLLDDAERVRRFLTSPGPCAAFDALWLPAFIAATFFLHPALGTFACGGAVALAGATVFAERSLRVAGCRLGHVRDTRYVLAWDLHAGHAGAERRARWQEAARSWDLLSQSYAEKTLHATERVHLMQAFGKGLRLALQSAGFGLGAFLALEGLLSGGGLVASSLILTRTFACLDGVLIHWSAFVSAHESCGRLMRACRTAEVHQASLPEDAGCRQPVPDAAGARS